MRKKPFSKNQILTLRKNLQDKPRDLALLNTAVDTCLRSSDLLSLKVGDVQNEWKEIREKIELKMKKTNKFVRCVLSDKSRDSLSRWIDLTGKEKSDYLFTPIRGGSDQITGLAFRKIIKGWCETCGWDKSYFSSHSLRRTLPSQVYKQTKDIRSCQVVLGHSSPANTALYLNVEEQDAFDVVSKIRF